MKIGLGLCRHLLTRDYYNFARQAGCSHVVEGAEFSAASHGDK